VTPKKIKRKGEKKKKERGKVSYITHLCHLRAAIEEDGLQVCQGRREGKKEKKRGERRIFFLTFPLSLSCSGVLRHDFARKLK